MTDSLIATLRRYGDETLQARYLPRFLSREPGRYFQGAQFMTEKFGGSDVGATDTRAVLAHRLAAAMHGPRDPETPFGIFRM